MPNDGTLAEYVAVAVDRLVEMPPHLNVEQAAANHGFTAPVNGVYLFSANVLLPSGQWVSFHKNHSENYNYGLTQNGAGNTFQTATSCVIPCAAGDLIQVTVSTAGCYTNGNSWFSGCLLYGLSSFTNVF